MSGTAVPPGWSAELARKLRSVDTPTICNALELAMGGRSAQGFTYGTLVAAPQPMAPMLGFARTACIRAAQPSAQPASALRQLRLDYYRHVAPVDDLPTLVVMQDLDERPGLVQRKEAPLLAAARGPGFSLAKIEAALREADDIH